MPVGNFQILPVSGVLTSDTQILFSFQKAGMRVRIKSISLVNTSGGNRTVNLYIAGVDSRQRITPKDMWIPDGGMARDGEEHILNNNCTILGDADINDFVTFTITGLFENV